MSSINNHSTSIRMPKSYDEWLVQFSSRYNVKKSYVLRRVILEFMKDINLKQST